MPAEIAQAVAAVEAETHRETQGNLPAFKQSFAYQPFLKFASPPQRKRTLLMHYNPLNHSSLHPPSEADPRKW